LPAKIKNLRVIEMKEAAARVSGILSGELDVAIGVPIDDMDRIKAAGHQVDAVQRTGTNTLRFMATRETSPFKDKRVRQAANYAINRPSMEKDLLRGVVPAAGQCATSGSFGYNANVKPYAYDPAKAKALLTEAGFANGFPVKIDVIPGNFPADTETYQLVAQNLNSVGIKAELEAVTYAQWLQKYTPGPEAKSMGFNDIFQNGCQLFTAHPLDAFPNLSCRKAQPSYCDATEMKLIEAIEAEFDVEKQRKLVSELLALNHENAAIMNLNAIPDLTGLHKRVRNFVNIAQRYDYGDISFQ
jgi:peptide/nickel transport system substrate-binding protein